MARVAADVVAPRALQYGADRGPRRASRTCIVEVMAAEGMHGRPRRPARHDRRPAGDRPRLQDADRPRRRRSSPRRRPTRARCRRSRPTRPTSCRSRWTTTACASTCSRRRSTASTPRAGGRSSSTRSRPSRTRRGVTMSLPRRRRLVEIAKRARAARARGQPVRAAALRGRRRCRRSTRSTAASTSSTSGRSRRSSRPGMRLGWAAAPAAGAREDEPRQAGRRPVLVVVHAVLRRRLLRASATGSDYVQHAARALPPPARRDARRARRALPARGDVDAARRAGCSSGRRCPTTSTRPTCWRARCASNVAFVPGRAAYLDGRGGSSMRLNFSGVGEDDIREGVRRIGKVVREQVALYGTLTGQRRRRAADAERARARRRPRGRPAPAAPRPTPRRRAGAR